MQRSLWKGCLAGAVGGVLGASAMNLFRRCVASSPAEPEVAGATPGFPRDGRGPQPAQADATGALDATVKVGSFAYEAARGRPPRAGAREGLGHAVHLAFGALTGALYGVAAERWNSVTACHGTAFGTVVWAAADEGVVPALRLSRGPAELSPQVHAYALSSHLVFGATLEEVRRLVRRWLHP